MDYMDLEVCQDCAAVIANGDWQGIAPAHAERIRAGLDNGAGHWVLTCDGENGHVDFSYSSCDCCGDRLGGSRCTAAILEAN